MVSGKKKRTWLQHLRFVASNIVR